ncbi:hypothetical protein [Streptomyces sp. URMC 129]|uniref:hypothetical protein n=1 Tax=Streptomyces sp. URMC 129 TaxID=3423407 RepID=UPI003F1C8A78
MNMKLGKVGVGGIGPYPADIHVGPGVIPRFSGEVMRQIAADVDYPDCNRVEFLGDGTAVIYEEEQYGGHEVGRITPDKQGRYTWTADIGVMWAWEDWTDPA